MKEFSKSVNTTVDEIIAKSSTPHFSETHLIDLSTFKCHPGCCCYLESVCMIFCSWAMSPDSADTTDGWTRLCWPLDFDSLTCQYSTRGGLWDSSSITFQNRVCQLCRILCKNITNHNNLEFLTSWASVLKWRVWLQLSSGPLDPVYTFWDFLTTRGRQCLMRPFIVRQSMLKVRGRRGAKGLSSHLIC